MPSGTEPSIRSSSWHFIARSKCHWSIDVHPPDCISIVRNKSIADLFRYVNFYVTHRTIRGLFFDHYWVRVFRPTNVFALHRTALVENLKLTSFIVYFLLLASKERFSFKLWHLEKCWTLSRFDCIQISQNNRAQQRKLYLGIYFIGTIVLIKYMPIISAVGLFCIDKFEENQTRKCPNVMSS